METKNISFDELNYPSMPIKELINMGMWFLYEVHNYQPKNVAYFILVGKQTTTKNYGTTWISRTNWSRCSGNY